MKQIIASVYFDILSYTIENIIVCIFKNFEFNLINIAAGVYKLRLAETNFPSCYLCHARVYKLRPAEVNFLSCYTPAEGIMISVRSLQRSDGDVSDPT